MTDKYKQACISYTFNELNPEEVVRQLERRLAQEATYLGQRIKLLPLGERNPKKTLLQAEVSNLSVNDLNSNPEAKKFKDTMAQFGWAVKIPVAHQSTERHIDDDNHFVRTLRSQRAHANVLSAAVFGGVGLYLNSKGVDLGQNALMSGFAAAATKGICSMLTWSGAHRSALGLEENRAFVGFDVEYTPLKAVSDTIIAGTDFGSKPNSAPALTG